MAKDLTEALRALTESGAGQTSRVDKALPSRPNPPAIPQRVGTAGPIYAGATDLAFSLDGEKTYTSSDGLFTIVFTDSIKTFIESKLVTFGVLTVEG
jgi:hypothetical protein